MIPKISKNQQLEVMTFRLEVVSTVPGSQAAAASEPLGLGDGSKFDVPSRKVCSW